MTKIQEMFNGLPFQGAATGRIIIVHSSALMVILLLIKHLFLIIFISILIFKHQKTVGTMVNSSKGGRINKQSQVLILERTQKCIRFQKKNQYK